MQKKKSLETLPENREQRWWGEVCREIIPQISGENWEGPPADGSEVEGWHNHLARVRWSESQSRWHISDAGEVGRQIRGRTAVHCSVAKYRDFEQDALWNTEPVKTGECIRNVIICCVWVVVAAVLFQSVSYAGENRRYVYTNLPRPVGLSVFGSHLVWADANLRKAGSCIVVWSQIFSCTCNDFIARFYV